MKVADCGYAFMNSETALISINLSIYLSIYMKVAGGGYAFMNSEAALRYLISAKYTNQEQT